MDYIETWKGVILSPSEFYRKMPKDGGYADPLTFAAISFAVYGLLGLFFHSRMYGMYRGGEFSFFMVLVAVIMSPIFGVIFLFLESAILHVIFKVLGGSGTYEGTFRFISYATAILLLSWIPFIGWIMGLYGIYLYIVGGSFVHNVSMGRSAIAVLLPTILLFILSLILAVLAGLVAYSSFVTEYHF